MQMKNVDRRSRFCEALKTLPVKVKLEEDGENMSPAFRLWATVSSLVFRYLIGSARS